MTNQRNFRNTEEGFLLRLEPAGFGRLEEERRGVAGLLGAARGRFSGSFGRVGPLDPGFLPRWPSLDIPTPHPHRRRHHLPRHFT